MSTAPHPHWRLPPRTTFARKGYQQLVEAITDYAIYMLDAGGMIVSWNPGAQRFKGYAAQEIIGQHFSRFYTPEDKATDLPRRALETAAKEGKFESEGWRVRKDGTRFWAHVVIDPIFDPQTRAVTGFAKITRDLTQRNAAAEKLRRSEEQFRLLVQSVTDYAIYMLDPEGIVSNWNLGAERIKVAYKAEGADDRRPAFLAACSIPTRNATPACPSRRWTPP